MQNTEKKAFVYRFQRVLIMKSLPSLNALRAFQYAGNFLSFTLAAKELNVTQGAVSRQIKHLEDFLGLALFVRQHQQLKLTRSGERLLTKLDTGFNLISDAVAELKAPNQRQKLYILSAPTFSTRWLVPKLPVFKSQFSQLTLCIHNHQEREFLYDAEIRFGNGPKPRYSSELLQLENHIAVCAPDLLMRAQNLENEIDSLLHITHKGRRLPTWKNWLNAAELNLNIEEDSNQGMEFNTLDQVITATKNGAGFAIIDKNMIFNELSDGSLMKFHGLEYEGEYGYWLDIHPDKKGLSKVLHFSQFLNLVHY